MIDIRSDTVTKPSKEMLEHIITAEVGDDEYKEDPTVNELEEFTANLLGFEAGLFVSSGLMGNQISLLNHTNPGDEVITTSDSHIQNYEHGAASFLSRIQFRNVHSKAKSKELNVSYCTKDLSFDGKTISHENFEIIYVLSEKKSFNKQIDEIEKQCLN